MHFVYINVKLVPHQEKYETVIHRMVRPGNTITVSITNTSKLFEGLLINFIVINFYASFYDPYESLISLHPLIS